MALKLYNSMTNRLEPFTPVHEGKVTMYNCGPTVYSYQHVGNFRSFVFADLLRRHLERKGFEVKQVVNITDVGHLTDDSDEGEDKMELAAKKERKHPLEIAEHYTNQFLEDWRSLNLQEPHARPKATEMIQEIIELVEVLLERGHAYEAGGNIYYDVTTFEDYGKLSGNTLDKLAGHRVEHDPNKRHQQDFVLWFRNSKFRNHILKWDSPWGEGYPGWHAECSVMSAKYLTPAFKTGRFKPEAFETIDIHTGGEDNKFPHHECEVAQTEGATDKKYVNYWLHPRHLIVEGEKMSKSIGNVYYVFSLVKEGYDPRAIRYVLMGTHFQQQLNFTKEGLGAARAALERLDDFLLRMHEADGEEDADEELRRATDAFGKALDDNLNVSGALAAVFDLMREANKKKLGKEAAKRVLEAMYSFDDVLGLKMRDVKPQTADEAVEDRIKEREAARQRKDWAEADRIRDELAAEGIELYDTPKGTKWRKK
ncbi:cysteine--tRNA ligase [Candidatus Woesearchaeota archaeon]|nr:cysteine--tRNA ligase [Candidatus Woesearchaeota archaeon]